MAKAKTLYNEQVKAKFLKDGNYTEGTRKDYRRVLALAYHVEVALNKDLHDFNSVEIEKVLYDMKISSFRSVEKNGWIISSYLNWAIGEGLRKESNPLSNIGSEFFKKFLLPEKLVYTEEEIRSFEAGCVNPQDAVIFALLFEGIGGSSEYDEIRTLRKDDIDRETNSLTFRDYDGNVTRTVEVSDYCISLIDDAIDQEEYSKKNGMMKPNSNVRTYTTLDNNDYVIVRSLEGVEHSNEPVIPMVIYRRMKTIQDTLGVKNLTAKRIQRSGEIYMGKKIIDEKIKEGKKPELTMDDIRKIARQFNKSEKDAYRIAGYVNVEAIDELYGVSLV